MSYSFVSNGLPIAFLLPTFIYVVESCKTVLVFIFLIIDTYIPNCWSLLFKTPVSENGTLIS